MADRLLTFRSGGWVLLLSALFCIAVIISISLQPPHQGDGQHVDTYGFSLTPSVIPREDIVASGFGKDVLPALVDPAMLPMDQAVKAMESEHSTLLKPADRIIGLSLNGDDRAYPPSVLVAHEVVNDTVGGIPVVITYNPLCDSSVVLQRTIDDKPLTFGVSGLLYNSCLLMYDRQADPKAESLWSPLSFKAVAGPSAAHMLKVIPCEYVTWSDWKTRHPNSKVLNPVQKEDRNYATAKPEYARYLSNDQLKFPTDPVWDAGILPNKTPVVAIGANRQWHVFVPARLAAMEPAARDALLASIPGVTLTFDPAAKTLRAQSTLPDFQIAYAFIFAWYSQHPRETTLLP